MKEQLAYLKIEVMAASPAKLRWLLIEAACQLARRSLQAIEAAQTESAFHSLRHLRQITLQLLTSLESHDHELGRDFQRLYLHLYRTATRAQLSGDRQTVLDMLQILEVERETWQTLTQRHATESAKHHSPAPQLAVKTVHTMTTSVGSNLCMEA